MIISHSKKFIFIRPRKCATTSLEHILMDYLDYEKDICTNEKFRDKSNENKIIRLDNIFLNIKNTLNILFKKKYYSKIIDYEFDHPHTKIIKIKNNYCASTPSLSTWWSTTALLEELVLR